MIAAVRTGIYCESCRLGLNANPSCKLNCLNVNSFFIRWKKAERWHVNTRNTPLTIFLMMFLDRSRCIIFFNVLFLHIAKYRLECQNNRTCRIILYFFFLEQLLKYLTNCTGSIISFFKFLLYVYICMNINYSYTVHWSPFDTPTRENPCEWNYFVAISVESREFFLYRSSSLYVET